MINPLGDPVVFLFLAIIPAAVYAFALYVAWRRPDTRWVFWLGVGIAVGFLGSFVTRLFMFLAVPLFLVVCALMTSKARKD